MGRTSKCTAAGESLALKTTTAGGKGRVACALRIGQTAHQKTGFDGRLEAPWRKIVIPFKIPRTLVHTTSKTTKKQPAKLNITNEREKDRQIFWAKSLEGIRAMVPIRVADKFNLEHDCHVPQRLELPPKLEVVVPTMAEESTTATFCASLHTFELNGIELSGQPATRKQIEENPLESLKFAQPFIQNIPPITEQDISIQERRVMDARKRLQELRRSFMIR